MSGIYRRSDALVLVTQHRQQPQGRELDLEVEWGRVTKFINFLFDFNLIFKLQNEWSIDH